MSNYTKSTDFASKDNLTSGDPLKIVKGTEIDTEFNNIATAVATKADLASPTFTGTVTIPTVSLTNDLPVTDGGTGASTAADARTNLSAAKSGSNSDITALSGLTTALSVSQGGTGAASLTANNVLLGNGTSALQAVSPGTTGNLLTSNGTTWTSSAPATVTSITAGGGLTGGTITSTGTIAVDTTFAAIGTYSLFWCTLNAETYSGSTVSGSYLFYCSSTGSGAAPPSAVEGFSAQGNNVNRTSSFTSASGVSAITFTNVSGTWRCLGSVQTPSYDPCSITTYMWASLWVRVS